MKRICLLLMLLLLLTGCAQPLRDRSILVSIEEAEGCVIENNGQRVLPGEDAVFTLTFDYGISLAGTDYDGKTRTDTNRRTVTLTLEDVRYPTRVKLSLTHHYVEITYHANGGTPLHSTEEQTTISYSLNDRARPNTNTGTELFARDGYTLLGWNTKPDGTGTHIGLGSRVTVPGGTMDLYAQWVKWCPVEDFSYVIRETATITGYTGTADPVVIPERIGDTEVTAIASGAFQGVSAATLVLPKSMDHVEEAAFRSCDFETLVLFDNIIAIRDSSFMDCNALRTLRINAIEAPYGYLYRKESCYADKVDLLIQAQGQRKLVFYGGCSMWYNLDGAFVSSALDNQYTVINMGLNGTVNSLVQMQILGSFLEAGDIIFHTPELSSRQQLLTNTDMLESDCYLWCGLENNYDLFTLVDLRTLGGVLDSLCAYLDLKTEQASYAMVYTGEEQQVFMDATGSVPFYRGTTQENLGDYVYLDPGRIDGDSMSRLKQVYDWYQSLGVRIYVSYACVNLDAVSEDQSDNVRAVEDAFRNALDDMEGVVLLSRLEDFLYHNGDFYDTNYHLLSAQTRSNTELWLRDLIKGMKADGLWKEDAE